MLSKENIKVFWFGSYLTTYHLENAEMTTELRDDLMGFSFDNLHSAFINYHTHNPNSDPSIFHFFPPFLECLKKLVCYNFHPCSLDTGIYEFYDTAII